MILIQVYICIGFIFFAMALTKLMPNMPLGEYRVIFKAAYNCENSKTLPFKANIYISKNSSKIREIKGNLTSALPFDDSLSIDSSIASLSETGGWKPNSMLFVTNNACSKLKSVLGKCWFSVVKYFNFPNENCPIPMGVYTTSGMDLTLLEDNNFPKVYFYGKYKFILKVKDKEDKLKGCVAAEIDLVRPWEV